MFAVGSVCFGMSLRLIHSVLVCVFCVLRVVWCVLLWIQCALVCVFFRVLLVCVSLRMYCLCFAACSSRFVWLLQRIKCVSCDVVVYSE